MFLSVGANPRYLNVMAFYRLRIKIKRGDVMDEYGKEKVALNWIKIIDSLKDLLSDHIPKHRHSDQF